MKTRGAETHFTSPIPPTEIGQFIREQIKAKVERWGDSPVLVNLPDGRSARVWLASDSKGNNIIGDARPWRVNLFAAAKVDAPKAIAQRDTQTPPIGFPLRVYLESEAPAIGCGLRRVLCQFRKKGVVLHHAGYTDIMTRDAFKKFVVSNKRYRTRNARGPKLRLVVSNPPKDTCERQAA